MSLIFSLSVFAAAGSPPAVADKALRDLVQESNACLTRQVEQRVPADMVRVSDEQRSAVRMAAVLNCDIYNEKLAIFSNEYRSGVQDLKSVSENMRVDSLRIADAMIVTRVKVNAGAAEMHK